jgi:hypothetical protein
MILLRYLKAGFEKGVTAVASQVIDDGLPAVLLNFDVSVPPSTPPLHSPEKIADNSRLRR